MRIPHRRLAALFTAASLLAPIASGDWPFLAVPSQSVHSGDYARMTVGADGSLHFILSTFYYAGTGDMNYHVKSGATWINEALWGDYGGIFVSPAFGADGQIQFLHNRGWLDAGYYLRLAARDQGIWDHRPVQNAGELPAPCALAIDANNLPHIVFAETNNGDLTYASFDGDTWATQVVGEDCTSSVFIGLSPAGEPRITFIDSSGDLVLTSRTGTSWSNRTIHAAANPVQIASVSVVTDPAGAIHAAYALRTGGPAMELRYARQTGTSFAIEVIPASPTFGSVSLALDPSGHPAIAYGTLGAPSTTDVRLTRFTTAWADEAVTSDGGSHLVDLVFLPSGAPVIAIQRGSINTVMFASPPGCSASACPADVNCSGNLSVQDIFDFLAAYFAGEASADNNASGTLSVQDVFDYLSLYFAGCS